MLLPLRGHPRYPVTTLDASAVSQTRRSTAALPCRRNPAAPGPLFFCPLPPSQLTDSVRLSRRQGFSPSFRGHIDIRNANPLDVSLFHAKCILPTGCLGGFNIVALVDRGKAYPLLMNPSPRVGVGISKKAASLAPRT